MVESWASSAATRASMLANRSSNTLPELALRRILHRRGCRYRVNYRPIVGVRNSADIVFTKAKVAVFVDGCFWHGCPKHFVAPKTNTSYWEPKIAANRQRDNGFSRLLQDSGWTVIRAWEHEPPEAVADRVVDAIRP